MKVSKLLSFALGLSVFAGTVSPLVAAAAPQSSFAMQGANISPTSPTDFGSAAMFQSLKNLKADNANQVNLVIPIRQSNEGSTDVGMQGNTPTDASLVTAIQEAHSLGLSVAIKPHLDPSDGNWRAFIDPNDRAAWFAAYGAVLTHYAQIAQAQSAEQMVLGTELIDMSSATHNGTNTQNWYALIASIRAVYSGQLGYAANWGAGQFDEMNQIQFWDKLDFIGVDLYYGFASGNESLQQMQTEYKAWNEQYLVPLQKKYGKPVQLTEVGYRSVVNANIEPGNYQTPGDVDLINQAKAYQALFSYWSTVPFVRGVTIWEWTSNPDAGGTNSTDYTPQGKPAEGIISAWYGGNGSDAALQRALAPLQAVATTSATSTQPGTSVTVSVSVQNIGTYTMANKLVDVELYDTNGKKVFQQFASAQTFTASSTTQYQFPWTPTTQGSYTVKVGIFSNDWSSNVLWIDNAASFVVGSAPVQPQVPVVPGTLSAVANTFSTAVNSVATIIAHVSNGGSALANLLIDTEVYDAAGTKVFQTFSPNQTLSAGSQKDVTSTFTPTIAGLYRIAVGIFSADWSKNFLWVNNAGTLTATTGGTGTTTPPVVIPPVATSTPSLPPIATTTPPTPPVATTTPPVLPVPPVATTTPPTPPVATTTPPTPTPAPTTTGRISGSTNARVGTSVNFGGSNFGHEESVSVTANGATVPVMPHADGGGNFSTGSLNAPAIPGTYTYVFTGVTSGIQGQIIVEVTS